MAEASNPNKRTKSDHRTIQVRDVTWGSHPADHWRTLFVRVLLELDQGDVKERRPLAD